MPAKRQSKNHNAEARRNAEDLQASMRRDFCTHFMFWMECGGKSCLRAHACAGDADKCFTLFWPIVPEEMKIGLRAGIEAKRAGLSQPEIKAAIEREMARWSTLRAPQGADESLPQAQPIAPGPRLRVL